MSLFWQTWVHLQHDQQCSPVWELDAKVPAAALHGAGVEAAMHVCLGWSHGVLMGCRHGVINTGKPWQSFEKYTAYFEFKVLPEHFHALDNGLLCEIIIQCNHSTSCLYHSLVYKVIKSSVINFSAKKAISVSILLSKKSCCCSNQTDSIYSP